ncbi:MAG: ribosome maturation factor RimP [Oscillospiraceae bacterium]|nr:ribosome maturation factor RimP [Oscillospiraceae bacterium]
MHKTNVYDRLFLLDVDDVESGVPTLSFVESPHYDRERCFMAKRKNTAQVVRELVEPIATELGLLLWDVRYEKEGSDWYLHIIIDKEGSVSIDDCEQLSRTIDPLLDQLDPTENPYYLSVSSPGLGRTIKTDFQLEVYIGRPVKVRLIRPDTENNRDYTGNLTSFDTTTFTLDNTKIITRKDTAYIKAADEDWEEI